MDRREFVKTFSSLPLLGVLGKRMQYVPMAKAQREVGGDTKYPIGVIYDGPDSKRVLGVVSDNKLFEQSKETPQGLETDFIADVVASFDGDNRRKPVDFFHDTPKSINIAIRESEELLGFFTEKGAADDFDIYAVMDTSQYYHFAWQIALEYENISICHQKMLADKVLNLYGRRIPVIRTRKMPQLNGRQVHMIILTPKSIPFPQEKWHSVGDWKCKFCHNVMARHRVRCEVCGEYRSFVV